MARWRDVKKGKVEELNKKKEKNKPEINISEASLLNRFKAFITDTFMLLMPLMYISFYFILGSREEFAQNMVLGWIYIMIPHFIITILFWFFKGQTPGLKAYELSIVDSDTGEKASLLLLINRYMFTTISLVLVLPLFIPYLNKKKKTLQDILSHTCVKNTPNDTV